MHLTHLVLIEEMARLPHDMGHKEPSTSLQRLAFPKDERVREQNHSDGRPKVTKLINRMIVRDLNVDVLIHHDLVVMKFDIVLDEPSDQR